ncbi:hypothetical protein [Sporosarcina sp. P17b]|uniref:hypothetical protein n=1 Tax=Sporosarcina sp. P17b TaxID=2048260 RepID=UPI000C1681BB|nr:hypothetical protein [Sporosarcina sp. P17b]PIC74868.1 hypothetical protein CSV76_03190 [Sporosarcina sp. P17b]
MKKRIYISNVILSLGLLSACSAETETEKTSIEQPSKSEGETLTVQDQESNGEQIASEQIDDLTQEEVLSAIKDQISTTNFDIVLPDKLPITTDQHLTATTSSESTTYQITFFVTDEPVPINNAALFDGHTKKEKLATLLVNDYKDQEGQAETKVAFEDYAKVGGEEVDLGHDITGYQDAGVGNLWTSWNEGRWSLATHTSIEQPEKGVDLGRKAVDYLETHRLPIPKQHGSIRLDATSENHYAIWAKGSVVYELSEVQSAMDLLEIVVHFQ